MKQRNIMDSGGSWVIGILGIIFFISIFTVFIMFLHNVSIGEWITKENYSDKSEWFKQIGLFVATMGGFSYTFDLTLDMIGELLVFRKQKNDIKHFKKHNKSMKNKAK